MVGVQQCIDKTVMDSHSKDEPQLTTVTMRPLNAAYHASTSQNQVNQFFFKGSFMSTLGLFIIMTH